MSVSQNLNKWCLMKYKQALNTTKAPHVWDFASKEMFSMCGQSQMYAQEMLTLYENNIDIIYVTMETGKIIYIHFESHFNVF